MSREDREAAKEARGPKLRILGPLRERGSERLVLRFRIAAQQIHDGLA